MKWDFRDIKLKGIEIGTTAIVLTDRDNNKKPFRILFYHKNIQRMFLAYYGMLHYKILRITFHL